MALLFHINKAQINKIYIKAITIAKQTQNMVKVLKFCTPKFLIKWLVQKCSPRSDCSFRSSLIRVYTVCHINMYFKKQLHKKQNLSPNSVEYSVQNFRTFTIYFTYQLSNLTAVFTIYICTKFLKPIYHIYPKYWETHNSLHTFLKFALVHSATS